MVKNQVRKKATEVALFLTFVVDTPTLLQSNPIKRTHMGIIP